MDDAGASLQATMAGMGRTAREGAHALRLATPEQRTAAIQAMAAAIREDAVAILTANVKDLGRAEANGVSGPMLDRLMLDEKRLEGVAEGVEAVAAGEEAPCNAREGPVSIAVFIRSGARYFPRSRPFCRQNSAIRPVFAHAAPGTATTAAPITQAAELRQQQKRYHRRLFAGAAPCTLPLSTFAAPP